jgi:hypothetical protein
MGAHVALLVEHQVVERLAADEDDVLGEVVARPGQIDGETTVPP